MDGKEAEWILCFHHHGTLGSLPEGVHCKGLQCMCGAVILQRRSGASMDRKASVNLLDISCVVLVSRGLAEFFSFI